MSEAHLISADLKGCSMMIHLEAIELKMDAVALIVQAKKKLWRASALMDVSARMDRASAATQQRRAA